MGPNTYTNSFSGARLVGAAALAVLAIWMLLPPDADARPTCGGRKATVVGSGGDDLIRASQQGPQVIYAGGGNDVIHSFRNKDRVCGGLGDDRILGGPGRDKLYGGPGNDFVEEGPGSGKVFAGEGDDTVLGGAGGDTVRGDAGNDRLFGEIQDDSLFGDAGDDLVVGGQGIDRLGGGGGNDWIRGDTNRDRYFGDDGSDTLSFATATPPGPLPGMNGVSVDLGDNAATGDDWQESVSGIENVVGSAFDDSLTGVGGGWVRGNGGPDVCSGFAVSLCQLGTSNSATVRIADADSPDPGLILIGANGAETFTISQSGGVLRISGSSLTPGTGCSGGSAVGASGNVLCTAPASELGYVMVWGSAGNDSIAAGDGLSVTTMFKGDGGPGNDQISGGPASDLIWAGETGSDRLFGNGGDDSLVGRPGGPDLLSGGLGSDQLVSDDPCAGHTYDGGAGRSDVAGFGHVSAAGVEARLGGKAVLRGARHCVATTITPSNEILEGSAQSDILIGDGAPNLIIGREGNDRLIGRGGRDELRGNAGQDRCLDGNAIKISC